MASVTIKEVVSEIRRLNPGMPIWYSEDRKQIMFAKGIDFKNVELPKGVTLDKDTFKAEGVELAALTETEELKKDLTEVPKSKLNTKVEFFLNSQVKDLIEAARKEASDDEKIEKDGIKILKKDEEFYDLLMTLLSILGDESVAKKDTRSSDVYDLFCKLGKDESNLKREPFRINKKDVEALKKVIPLIEKYLGKNLILPNEIYQLKNGDILPEVTDKKAPEPKTLAETEEEYEKRLEDHYGSKEMMEDVEGVRKPYPHERTVYSADTPRYATESEIAKNNYPSEYYNDYAGRKISKTPPRPESDTSGEMITDEDLETKATLKQKLKGLTGGLKDKITITNVLKALAIAGIVGATLAIAPHAIAALGTLFGKVLMLNGASPFAAGVLTGSQIKAIISALIAAGVITYAVLRHKKKKGKGVEEDPTKEPKEPTKDDLKLLSPEETAKLLNAALAEKQKTDATIKIKEIMLEVVKRKKDGTFKLEEIADLITASEDVLTPDQISSLQEMIKRMGTPEKEELEKDYVRRSEELKKLYEAQKIQLKRIQEILEAVKEKGGITVGGLAHA